MTQIVFGSGTLWATPTSDAYGNSISNPTPQLFGIISEVSLDLSFDVKALYGQGQWPVDIGRGKGKADIKAKFAQVKGGLYNALMFGQAMTNGIDTLIYDTVGQAIPATPFQLTVSPPNSGSFAADLGVRDSNGLQMTRVAVAPATGQYAVNGSGQYTFAAADTGRIVFIDYRYTAASSTAKKQTVMNLPMGSAPTFSCDLLLAKNGKTETWHFYNCTATKLSVPTKQEDFRIAEMQISAFADPNTGKAYDISTTE